MIIYIIPSYEFELNFDFSIFYLGVPYYVTRIVCNTCELDRLCIDWQDPCTRKGMTFCFTWVKSNSLPDGYWEQISWPANAIIHDPHKVNTQVELPVYGIYKFRWQTPCVSSDEVNSLQIEYDFIRSEPAFQQIAE